LAVLGVATINVDRISGVQLPATSSHEKYRPDKLLFFLDLHCRILVFWACYAKPMIQLDRAPVERA